MLITNTQQSSFYLQRLNSKLQMFIRQEDGSEWLLCLGFSFINYNQLILEQNQRQIGAWKPIIRYRQNIITYNYLTMRNIRKLVNHVSTVIETVLQYRLEPSCGLAENLSIIGKKISKMNASGSHSPAIVDLLVGKESYKIKNKINKELLSSNSQKTRQLFISVEFKASEKLNGEVFNCELWNFGIQLPSIEKHEQENGLNTLKEEGIVHVLEFVIKNLKGFELVPVSNFNRNKYIISQKVTISESPNNDGILHYQDISERQIYFSSESKISIQYLLNNSRATHILQQFLRQKNEEASDFSLSDNDRCSKRCSDSTNYSNSHRVSIFEHYDEQLDITILSNSDQGDGEEIVLGHEDNSSDEQFQILIDESVSYDQLFLKDNQALIKELTF